MFDKLWIFVIILLMFVAGPSVPAILFSMAANPQYDVFIGLTTTMKVTGIIFWIADWGMLIGIGVAAIKKVI